MSSPRLPGLKDYVKIFGAELLESEDVHRQCGSLQAQVVEETLVKGKENENAVRIYRLT